MQLVIMAREVFSLSLSVTRADALVAGDSMDSLSCHRITTLSIQSMNVASGKHHLNVHQSAS